MKKLLAMSMGMALAATSAFAFAACGENDANKDKNPNTEVVKVEYYMPDGAPALSMAKMMHEASDSSSYHVVEASTIKTYVTGEAPKADVCVLPLNLASNLLGTGETYQMLGTVTHGNLYMLSTNDSVKYETGESLSGLIGKKVGVIQLANVPGLTFKAILNDNNIAWQEMNADTPYDETKVNLIGIADPATGVSPATGYDVYVAAEPLVSVKTANTSLKEVGDLQALYGGENGYPQAVVVAKSSFIAENVEWVNDFVEKTMPAAAEWLKEAEAETVISAIASCLPTGQTPTFNAKNLTKDVISRCGIRFVSAKDSKAEVNAFLAKLIEINPKAAKTVSDAFFYGA